MIIEKLVKYCKFCNLGTKYSKIVSLEVSKETNRRRSLEAVKLSPHVNYMSWIRVVKSEQNVVFMAPLVAQSLNKPLMLASRQIDYITSLGVWLVLELDNRLFFLRQRSKCPRISWSLDRIVVNLIICSSVSRNQCFGFNPFIHVKINRDEYTFHRSHNIKILNSSITEIMAKQYMELRTPKYPATINTNCTTINHITL